MSEKTYPYSAHHDLIGKDVDKISETAEDFSSVGSKSGTQAAHPNIASEHHRSPAGSSKDLGSKKQHETTDQNPRKKTQTFSGAEHQQDTHCIPAETPRKVSQSDVPSSIRPSVIRHTNEYLHIPCPAENVNATPELISETEDPAQARTSANLGDDIPLTSKPSHYICNVCNKCFSYRFQLKRHYATATHTVEKPFSCTICGEKFLSEDILAEHDNRHSQPGVHECDQCRKIFNYKHHLQRHYHIHTAEKPFVCEKCGEKFSDQGRLWRHRSSSSKTD